MAQGRGSSCFLSADSEVQKTISYIRPTEKKTNSSANSAEVNILPPNKT